MRDSGGNRRRSENQHDDADEWSPWFITHRPVVLVLAGVLFCAVAVLRGAESGSAEAITVFYVAPVTLLATSFGARGGSVGAVIAVLLIAAAVAAGHVSLTPLGWAIRLTPILLGVLVGHTVDRFAKGRDHATRLGDALRQVFSSEARLAAIVTSSQDAIVGLNLDGTIETWNRGAEAMYGYRAEEAIGRHVSLLAPFAAREVLGHVEAVAHGARVVRHEGTRTRRDGSTIDVLVTVSPICDEGGTVVGASSIACDITDRKRTEADLAHRATHDDLTGLPNRLLLVDRMAQALARCERDRHRELVVLFLDLDGLKLINDTAGHPAGDAVLVAIAERLRAAVRPSDTVARFAGDEFVVVCEDTDRVHGEALGYRIADELAGPVEVGGRTISPSLSIGLSIGSSGDTADELLKQADIAMYEAKAAGGGRLATFDRDLQARLERHVLLDAALRRAVDEGEFRVVYQPIVSLDTGRIVSAEALLRWDAPDPAWAMPSEFIPAAEANGLIVPIGAWVVDEVVRQVEAWAPHLADDFSVSINLSAAQLTADLADTLFALRDRHIDPRRITFELTETVLLADDDLSIEALLGLKLLGARIALDDFGTGYSSLAYLQRLPVDTIKIDRSFITSIASRRESAAIVEAVTTMARTLGLSVTAEGVETGEHLDAVKALGCTFAQGYYWSSAVSADEFLPLLAGATAVSAAGHAA